MSTERLPGAREETVRETIKKALREGPATAHDLSGMARIREKDVAEHLEHLDRSLVHSGERLVVEPATCLSCGFVFRERRRLTRPGSCPQCRGTRIDPPAFRIEAFGGASDEDE